MTNIKQNSETKYKNRKKSFLVDYIKFLLSYSGP